MVNVPFAHVSAVRGVADGGIRVQGMPGLLAVVVNAMPYVPVLDGVTLRYMVPLPGGM